MNPERWGTIKKIFEEAMEQPEPEQLDFVRNCAYGDATLEAQVLRLLRAHGSTADFLETPAADLHAYLDAQTDEPFLEAGAVVADRFEIIRFLNRGGMGEVYEAWDAELKEPVALKTIRRSIASSHEAIERFKIEVKQAREVSHLNICRVHELFSHDAGTRGRMWFLSMELLRGKTLLEHIRSDGPLDAATALGVTTQMVSGLEAAHGRGLVHRDFKSSNVILIHGAAGHLRAVITDFGLSLRTLRPESALSEPGGMGTPGYRAPEQEQDGQVGHLADQYSLGVVICEMLTGTLPRWSRQVGGSEDRPVLVLPGHRFESRWEAVIRRCLQREPAKRFPRICDVSKALKPPGILGTPTRVAAAVALLLLLAGAGLLWRRNHNRCRICDVVQLTPETDESESPSLSRDGHAIVYSSDRADTGNLDIFVQTLPNGAPRRLTTHPAKDDDPAISPDGSTVVFRSERDGGGIYLAAANGSLERLLVPRGRNPKISPDGRSLLYWTGDLDPGVASGKVFLLNLDGGKPVQLVAKFQDARFPVWSPDGRAIGFFGCETPAKTMPGCAEWWVADPDGKRVVDTGVLARLQSDGIVMSRPDAAFWCDSGLLFSGGINGLHLNLWLIKLHPHTWKMIGGPKQLLDEPARDLSPSLAEDGSIAYTRISGGALHIWHIEHVSPAGATALAKVTEDAEIDGSPFISEGGRFLVFGRGRGTKRSIWVRDKLAPPETLLLSSGLPVQSPIIDRSGDLLVYEQIEHGETAIYVKPREGPVKRVCQGCSLPSGWFDSDRGFFYRDGTPSTIRLADPRTGRSRIILQEPNASLGDATWSPANQFMLFSETRGDRKQIFAAHLPRSSAAVEGKWIPIPGNGVSPDHPRWSGDGRTIFYIANVDGFACIYGQPFSPEAGTVIGKPFNVAHFHNQRASIDNVAGRAFNLSVDGDTVYFNLGEQSSTIWIGSFAGR